MTARHHTGQASARRNRLRARPALAAALGLATTALFSAACGNGTTDPDPPDKVNRPPVAAGTIPSQTVEVGQTATVDLADYFSDPDGDALTYAAQSSNTGVATVSLAGSNAVVTGVSKGDVTITATATDAGGLSAAQSFSVRVPNRAPEATGIIGDLELLAGDTAEIDVSGYFTDPDGDGLTYAAATSDADVATAAVAGATVTIIAVSDGTASFTVTASDTEGLTAEQSFSATVDPLGDPVIQFLTGTLGVREGGTIVVELEARPTPRSTLDVGYSIGGDGDPETRDADETDHEGGSGGTVRFDAGARHATLRIAVRDDDEIDPTREVIGMVLDAPEQGAGYLLGAAILAVATIEEGVCDRTPRIRDELMAIRGVDECHEIDPAHLAAIDTLDLRGPPPNMDAELDFRSSIGAWHRSCGSRPGTVSRGHAGELPAAELEGCLPPANLRMGPLPPPSTVRGGNVDALGELRAGDFGELTELEQLWLFDNELSELPAGIFSELSELQFLSMDRNRLRSLPDGLLAGLFRLRIFSTATNELFQLPPDLFAGLPRLEEVWMYQNELVELPAGLFSDLGNLEELYLWENRIDALPAGSFAGLGRLRVLVLGTNLLTELDGSAFADLPELEQLDVAGNRLSGLPPGVFANLGELRLLLLGGNRLAELRPGVLASLTSLESLSLSNNRLETLGTGVFSELSELEWLHLAGNRLEVLEPGLFSPLSGLEVLVADSNRISDLAPGTFEALGNLRVLTLGGNPFTELTSGTFEGLSRLDELWVTRGDLRVLHPGAFNGLSGLTKLLIQENRLTALESGVLTGLPALTELWLYSNQIHELADDALTGTPRLRQLILWGNRLTELPSGVFSALTGLETLSMSHNQLVSLPTGVFSGLGALRILSANENNLAELPAGVFTGLSQLTSVNLDLNPGTPFPLDVQLERTDTTDLAAPGPAQVVLSLAAGAPFSMRIPLSVAEGTLSTDTAVIVRGQATSAEFTVTMSSGSQSGTEVVIGPPPPVPFSMIGVHLVAADTLVLFTTSGDVSGAEPIDLAVRRDGQTPEGGGGTPVMLVAGFAGSAGWRLRRRSTGKDARSRTGCSAAAARCTPAARDRSAGVQAWSRRAVGRAP